MGSIIKMNDRLSSKTALVLKAAFTANSGNLRSSGDGYLLVSSQYIAK
jgi:hypothetical protein